MAARRAITCEFLLAVASINFICFTLAVKSQECHTAHDEAALQALEQRADAGDADAQGGLGKQYEFGLGVHQDNNQSVLWLQKAAQQGDLRAEVELGVVYDKMQDYPQALIWYRKAAEQGHARAEYNLGLAYQNGEAVPRDMTQAIFWYRKAADQGDMIAQNNLAVVYDQGIGVPHDYAQAAEWYRKAADQGFAEAQYGLGFLYLNGNGVPKDDAQAVAWMLKAAEQGQTLAQYNLGSCYINGAGVGRDLREGYFWVYLAIARTTDAGLKGYAENSLENLTGAMKKDEIKNAQKRAQAWLKEHPARIPISK